MLLLVTSARCPFRAGERSFERGRRALRQHREELRRLQKQVLETLSSAPESVDPRGLRLPPKQRAEAIARLRRHLANRRPEAADRLLSACLLLIQLGHESGMRGLVRLLGSSSSWVKRSALVQLGLPHMRQAPRDEGLRRALCRPAAVAAVAAVLSEPDAWNRMLAAQMGDFWGLPMPEPVLFAALADPTVDGTPPLLKWLCSRGYDPRTGAVAREVLLDRTYAKGAWTVIAGLEGWLKSDDARARREAEAILLELLASQETELEKYREHSSANPRVCAVGTLARSGSGAAKARVRAVALSSMEPGPVRIEAWEQLILDGRAHLDEVVASDLAPNDQSFVVTALAMRVRRDWQRTFETQPKQVERITAQLLALRGRQPLAPAVAESLESELPLLVPRADRKRVLRSVNVAPVERCSDWSELARRLVACGAVAAGETRKAIMRGRAASNGGPPDWTLIMREAGRLTEFDTECGDVPPRYERPLSWLAAGSAGTFRPTHIAQVWYRHQSGFGGPQLVNFVLKGTLVAFHARDLGDYYDLPSMVTAVNEALEATKIRERFVLLEGGGQFATIVFIAPGRTRAVTTFLGRPATADLDAPMKAGRGGEACARSAIT